MFLCRHGWRSFFWLSTALSAFVTLLLVVGFPETRYFHRENIGHATVQASKFTGEEIKEPTSNHAGIATPPLADTDSDRSAVVVGKGRPSKSQFGAWQKPDSRWKQFLLRDLASPIQVFINP